MTGLLERLRPLRGPVALIAAVSFVSSLGIGVMLPLMPLYALSLGASPLQLGLMTSVFALANTAGQLVAGLRMDRAGSLPFIRVGTGVYAAANALIATAQDAVSLIAYRGLAGLGAGANLVGSRVYLTQVAPPERLGLVNGVIGSVGAAGSVVGPAFGGGIVALFDLRAPFLIVAVTSGIALLGLLALPRPAAQPSVPRADAPASALNRSVVTLLLANALLAAGYGGFITTYAPFATEMRAWTLFEVGLLFTIAGSGSIVFGAAMGHLADRVGRRRVAILAPIPASLMGFAMVLGLERGLVYITMFIAGAAIAGFTASWFALLNDASPEGRKGRTFGFVSALSNVGTILGALGASVVWQLAGVQYGLVLASTFLLLAGPVLLALPSELRRSATTAQPAAATAA
ncbi:MAG: MFS transporter [Elusimicrobia bacterium]|nr:MFS transporter [Elusimicrobiota bacterium]